VSLFSRQAGNPGANLLSPDDLYAALERERLRADRTGSTFAVVSFSPVWDQVREATAAELARILRPRLRGSDQAGLMADGRVGLLLPDTPAAGARTLADGVLAQWTAAVPAPVPEIYVYPSDVKWWERLERIRAAAGIVPEAQPAARLLLKPMPRWKRALDVAGAGLGLLLLSPMLAVVAAAIKLSSPGPVFFKQRRAGRGGVPFWMYKFRSMVADAESQQTALRALNERDGPTFKIERDPRVTRLGRFLRATNIDELPQLWNVFQGDMSLVGPRPLPCDESDACTGWQRRRLDVTPGLTCIWQAHAHRAKVSFVEWVRMDLRYIKSLSLKLDLRLILHTLKLTCGRKAGK
jgi:lipopolysaccharide/colanic/teichoic acid biosynthesis glycosyltransferase